MNSAENNAGAVWSPQYEVSAVAEMVAFDALPPDIRAVLRNTATNYGSDAVLTCLRWGVPRAEVIAEIGRHERNNHQALVKSGWGAP